MIYNVGIDMSSLVDDYGFITGNCIIYEENNVTEKQFTYEPQVDSVRSVTYQENYLMSLLQMKNYLKQKIYFLKILNQTLIVFTQT